jgi:hypothetical protein
MGPSRRTPRRRGKGPGAARGSAHSPDGAGPPGRGGSPRAGAGPGPPQRDSAASGSGMGRGTVLRPVRAVQALGIMGTRGRQGREGVPRLMAAAAPQGRSKTEGHEDLVERTAWTMAPTVGARASRQVDQP